MSKARALARQELRAQGWRGAKAKRIPKAVTAAKTAAAETQRRSEEMERRAAMARITSAARATHDMGLVIPNQGESGLLLAAPTR